MKKSSPVQRTSEHRSRSKHSLFALALLLGGLCAGGTYLSMRGTHAPVKQSARSETSGPAKHPAQVELPRGFVPSLSSDGVALSPMPVRASDSGQPRSPHDELRDRVMRAHPDIAQFRHLQRKVLLRPEEKETLREIYQDEEILAAAKHDLLAENEKTFSEERQFQRLYRVEYLGMGLEWQDNPRREKLLGTVKELISTKNLTPDQDQELRRSLAGDKVELFMILLHNDRAQAEQLLADARGTDIEKLLEYAKLRYDVLQRMATKG